MVLPIIYVLGMLRVWFDRAMVRAKSGAFGVFSLWFPLLTTSVAAWVLLALVPSLYGTPIGTLMNFSPDFGLALVASAVTGVLLSVFRLGVAYTGKSRPA